MNMMEAQTRLEELQDKCDSIANNAGAILAELAHDRVSSGKFSKKNFINDIEKLISDFPSEIAIKALEVALADFANTGNTSKKSRTRDDDDYLSSMFGRR